MPYTVAAFCVIAFVASMFGIGAVAAGAAGLVFVLLLAAAVLAGARDARFRTKDSRGV